MRILNGPFTIAVVVYNPSQKVIENANNIFASVRKTLGESNVQCIVVDNSPQPNDVLKEQFKSYPLIDVYHWNQGYNIYWAGGINKAVQLSTGEVFIHFLPTRGIERNPDWVKKLIAPLVDEKVGMSGPVRSCYYDRVTGDLTGLETNPAKQYHVQQAVFAARTHVLKDISWGPNHPHAYSDVEHSINLIRAGYQLVNVPEVSSTAANHASNPNSMFECGQHIKE